MMLTIPRIEMKRLDVQMRKQVAWEVDNLVRDLAHLERFRQQIKVCNEMVTAYEEPFEEQERLKKERRETLRAKYRKDISKIKRYGKYRGDKAPDQGYEWMEFLDKDDAGNDVRGWVKIQDASDLLDEDDVFPLPDLPPKPFPAPEVIVTGQRTDSRSPEGDEYLPGYFWMLAAVHDTTLKQRSQIITEREELHEKLAFELAAGGMMLKAPPYTYEHVGCALDDVRADLRACFGQINGYAIEDHVPGPPGRTASKEQNDVREDLVLQVTSGINVEAVHPVVEGSAKAGRPRVIAEAKEKASREEADALTELQTTILEELDGEAMRAEYLTRHLKSINVKRSVRAVKAALAGLQKAGKVKNRRGLGYYRPDKPPKLAERQ